MASVNLSTDPVPRPLFRKAAWIRPTLRAIGLVTSNGAPGAPRRTLDDLDEDEDVAADFPNGVPPWIYRKTGGEPIELDWLPSKVEGVQGAATLYAYNKLVRIIDDTPWPTALAAALKEIDIVGLPPDRFARSLVSTLSLRLQIKDREVIATLHKYFIEAFDFSYKSRAGYRMISPLIYPNGPIFLDMPAVDAKEIRNTYRPSPLSAYKLRDVIVAVRGRSKDVDHSD